MHAQKSTLRCKFTKEEREAGIPNPDNCFVFSTPDGQLFIRVGCVNRPFSCEDEFDDLFREYYSLDRN